MPNTLKKLKRYWLKNLVRPCSMHSAAVADLDEITPDVVKATIKGIMKETKFEREIRIYADSYRYDRSNARP